MAPDPKQLGDWLGVAATVGGWLAAASSIVLLGWRWFRRAIRAVAFSHRLHDHFGDSAAEKLIDAITHLRTFAGEHSIRQSFIEHKFDIGIYVCDSVGMCTWSNDTLCQLFGLDLREMVGTGWLRGVEETQRQMIWSAWDASVAKRIPYDAHYTVVNQRTGERRRVKTKAFALVLDGSVVCYVGYVECEFSPE